MDLKRHGAIRYAEALPATRSNRVFVLMHGLGGSLEQWQLVMARMARAEHVIALDVPGFGDSKEAITAPFDIDRAAYQISEFISDLDLQQCVLVSHSISCVVAGKVAALQRDRFDQVIFVSGALIRASEIAQRPYMALVHPYLATLVLAQFAAGMFRAPPRVLSAAIRSPLLRRAVLWPFVAKPEKIDPSELIPLLDKAGSPAVLQILLNASRIDFRRILSSLDVPVALVHGDADRLIGDEDLVELRRLVTVNRVRVLHGCGHWPWVEDVDGLVASLLE